MFSLINKKNYLRIILSLTLKSPNKNCSRRHFNFLLLFLEKIRLDFSCEAEDSLETSSLIFSEKQ